MKPKTTIAESTGSTIWLFHGVTQDGNYFLADDYGVVRVLDEDPAKNWDESVFEEWQQEHLIVEIMDKKENIDFCNQMFDILLQNEQSRNGMTEMEIESYRSFIDGYVLSK